MSWFAPSELAGLPSMPTTRKCVKEKAQREDWESRDRIGRGGGKEYLVPDRYLSDEFLNSARSRFPDKFPTATKVAEPVQMVQITQPKTADVANLPKAPKQEIEVVPVDSDNSGVWARQEIVRIWKAHLEANNDSNELLATLAFCQGVQDGSILIPDWVKDGLKAKTGRVKISRNSLINWSSKTATELVPKHKGKVGTGFFDLRPEYLVVAEAVAREFGANPKQVHFAFVSGFVREDFGLEEVPTESQIGYWLRNLKAENTQRARAWASGDKSILLNAQGSYSRGLQPNDKWEIDSTKADAVTKKDNVVWLQSRFGEAPVRCALVACIDVATRMVKVKALPTSDGEAISILMAECVTDWGLPKTVKTDNGKDYISKQVFGFTSAMGIEQKLCVVKQPWQKPHIERFMRTLQHSVEWGMLPWNTGHSVAMQMAYRKRREGEVVLAWTIAEFQSWIDRWVQAYHNRLHEGLGCSPNERLAAFRADGFKALMPRNLEANLAFALLKEEEVTLKKNGIPYNGRNYIAPELQGRVGDKFYIRVNQADSNQIVVYDGKDLSTAKLICVATWDMALTPEEQARIATAKPVVEAAVFEHEQAVKSARRKLKTSVVKNPEKLLPERGGVAAFKAIQEIEAASSNMVDQIAAAVSNPQKTSQISQAEQDRWIAKLEPVKPEIVDLDELLKRVTALWIAEQPIPEDEKKAVILYVSQPTGRGALGAIIDMQYYKAFLRWVESEKKAVYQTAN